MSFAGFTNDSPSVVTHKVPRKASVRKQEKLLMSAVDRKAREVGVSIGEEMPPEARLCTPVSSPVKLLVKGDGKCEVVSGSDPPNTQPEVGAGVEGDTPGAEAVTVDTHKAQEVPDQLKLDLSTLPVTSDPSTRNPSSNKLELFQEKQRLIEEQNRKRKEMLSKVISDRKKQTASETRKLEIVQQELQKIDFLLNTDVQYLRDSIEQASFDFMKAQKRYDDAEKEFVDAKMNLFGVMERKELLTDHLCSIIEQNEMRKAKKLNELMEDLDLETVKIDTEVENGDISLTDLRQPGEINTLKKSESVSI